MNAQNYLQQTEDAIGQLIQAAIRYEEMVAGHTFSSEDMEAGKQYFGFQFSQSTLCGAILQVAFMGIDLFSKNENVPQDCSSLLGTSKKSVKFCVGRRIHDIPIGLLIYAGRNQYNHWDDQSFDFPTTKIFEALIIAHYDNLLFDMAYELNYPARTIKSNHIVLGELGWNNYDAYYRDMKELITV